jgi:hypothetical protein
LDRELVFLEPTGLEGIDQLVVGVAIGTQCHAQEIVEVDPEFLGERLHRVEDRGR